MTHPPFRATSINDHKTQGVALSMVLLGFGSPFGRRFSIQTSYLYSIIVVFFLVSFHITARIQLAILPHGHSTHS